MKKLVMILAVAMLSVSAFAQKGRQGFGVSVSATPLTTGGWNINQEDVDEIYVTSGFSVSLKYDYYLSKTFRVEPYIKYH